MFVQQRFVITYSSTVGWLLTARTAVHVCKKAVKYSQGLRCD